jgi:hypothetical protein
MSRRNFASRITMKGASFGTFGQRGGVIVISSDDAFLVLRKWADDAARLCVFSEMGSCHFFCFGELESADFPMVRFLLDEPSGVIDIYLPETTRFEYGDPDSIRLKVKERMGLWDKRRPARYGPTICGVRENGDGFVFVEVMEEA